MADSVAQQKYRRVRDILNLLKSVRDTNLADSITTVNDLTRGVRDGKTSHVSHLFTSISDDATAELLIKVGEKELHVYKKISITGEATFRFFEGTAVSSDGTSVPTVDRNRNDNVAAFSTFFHTPTVTDVGTELSVEVILGGTSNGGPPTPTVGAASGELAVWVLKPNTNYLIRTTNTSGSSQRATITADFFEVDT
mgnify:CR=1 FL=1